MAGAAAVKRSPFAVIPLEEPTILQRLLRRKPRSNAWIEVNNLLASVVEVRGLRPEQIARIAERYRMPMRGEFCGRLERFYRDYLLYCLADHHLTDDELADLAHLKRILRLSEQVVSSIHDTVSRQVYAQSVDAVLEDGRIDSEEREFLHTLQHHLALSSAVVDRIMETRRRQH